MFYPPRQCLGALLSHAPTSDGGNNTAALEVFETDLLAFVGNAWSLYGAATAASNLGMKEKSDEYREKADHAWKDAESIKKNPTGDSWNSICDLDKFEDLESKNIVKASINEKGRIIYIFRKTPSFAKPNNQFIYIKKIQGLIAFRKDVLEKLSLLPESYGEKFESIEQLRIISYGFKLEGVMQKDQVPSINEKKDLDEFFEYLKKNKTQNKITQSLVNDQ